MTRHDPQHLHVLIWFYHVHIVSHEANAGDVAGLPLGLEPGYKQTEDEARAIYQWNMQ